MRIIREGNKHLAEIREQRLRQFECKSCLCIWRANKDEYLIGNHYNELYYYMNCPCCGRVVYDGSEVEIQY